jgi:hypothetical protein
MQCHEPCNAKVMSSVVCCWSTCRVQRKTQHTGLAEKTVRCSSHSQPLGIRRTTKQQQQQQRQTPATLFAKPNGQSSLFQYQPLPFPAPARYCLTLLSITPAANKQQHHTSCALTERATDKAACLLLSPSPPHPYQNDTQDDIHPCSVVSCVTQYM